MGTSIFHAFKAIRSTFRITSRWDALNDAKSFSK